MTGVPEDLQHESPGLVVEQDRDLTVEVGGDAVADVCLDQTLEPVGRGRGCVECVERGDEGTHGVLGRGTEVSQPGA
jgi:hypothetical protein